MEYSTFSRKNLNFFVLLTKQHCKMGYRGQTRMCHPAKQGQTHVTASDRRQRWSQRYFSGSHSLSGSLYLILE